MSSALLLDSRRWIFASVHFLLGVAVFALLALPVFGLWYRPPFQHMSGGLHLYFVLAAVDTALGPLLTFIVAAVGKPIVQVQRDLAIIVAVQLCAFGYGLSVLVDARPAWISFERVQFRVVAAGDIQRPMLVNAPIDFRSVPWNGPRLIAAVLSPNADEQFRSMQEGLAGFDLSLFPRNWRSYESEADRAWTVARPATELLARDSLHKELAEQLARSVGKPLNQLRYLPVKTKDGQWSVLLTSPGAKVVGYVPIEGE